jgi:hypothetical protein
VKIKQESVFIGVAGCYTLIRLRSVDSFEAICNPFDLNKHAFTSGQCVANGSEALWQGLRAINSQQYTVYCSIGSRICQANRVNIQTFCLIGSQAVLGVMCIE